MMRALAGHASVPFEVPDDISFADIDAETGQARDAGCPKTFNEAFLAGTEPTEMCDLHR